MPKTGLQPRRIVRRRAVKYSAWRSLNVLVGVATIIHLAAFGIIVPSQANALDTTFLSPTSNTQNGFFDSWSNASNAYANGGGAATEGSSNRHRYYDYGFVVPPTATISGIEVKADAWSSDSNGCELGVDLSWNGGSSWSNEKTQSLTNAETTYTLGTASDLWGSHTWVPVDFSNANFRLRVRDIDPGQNCSNATTSLDWIQARVTYTAAVTTGTVELKKVWSGTPGSVTLNIGTTVGGSDTASTTVSTNGTTGTKTVNTGTYYFSENGSLSNFTSSLACTDNGTPVTPGANNSLVLATGHAIICTYTNTRTTGTIELQKIWSGTPGTTTLTIGSTNGASDIASTIVSTNGTTGPKSVNTGTYFAAESAIANFTPSALVCFNDANTNGTNDNEAAVAVGANNSVAVTTNQHVICAFTNTRNTGTIEVQKVWVGTKGITTVAVGTTAGGSQVYSQQIAVANGTTGPRTVDTGTYYLSETALSKYSPALTCNAGVTIGANNSISVGANQNVVCKFTNTRRTGTIELKKVWSGVPSTTTLNIGTAPGGNDVTLKTVSANDTTGVTTVDTGTYFLSETTVPGYTSALSCDNGVTLGASNSIQVGDGQNIVCTFTNTENVTGITISKVGAASVVAGTDITYTIGWSVNGNTGATNAIITDAIPASTSFVSATNGGVFSLGTVTWNLGAQPVGASGTVSATLHVVSPLPNGTGISNSATFDTDQTSPVTSTVRTLVTSAPSLSITKANSVSTFVAPGATVTYTVVVSNASSATENANDVVLTDVLPTGFTYTVGGGTAKSFSLGTIAPGSSVTTSYQANVSASQATGMYINTATAKGTNTANVTTTSTVAVRAATATTPVIATPTPVVLGAETANPTLVVTKTVDTTVAHAGQIVNYTVTIKNTGPGEATNVALTDTLPGGLTFVETGKDVQVWNIGTMAVGAVRTFMVAVEIASDIATGTYMNTALVSSNEIDPVTAHASIHVTAPQVLGLATTGAGQRDYLMFSFGVLLMIAGYSLARRQPRPRARRTKK